MYNRAPIVLLAYNRPSHLQKTLTALQHNVGAAESELYVFADGPRTASDIPLTDAVRSIIKQLSGFKAVHYTFSDQNLGLAASVIKAVSRVLEKHETIIVLEDDIVTKPTFLTFCNEALHYYADKKDIFSISGYSFPVHVPSEYPYDIYITPRASSWGWCTWKDRWALNDWGVSDFNSFISDKAEQHRFNEGGVDLTRMLSKQMHGKINSWAIRWCYTHFKNHAYCLYPKESLVENIGNDNSGTHSPRVSKFDHKKPYSQSPVTFRYPLPVNPVILKNVKLFFKKRWKDRFEYLISKFIKK